MVSGMAMALLSGCQEPPQPRELRLPFTQSHPFTPPTRDGNWKVGAGYEHAEAVGAGYWPEYQAVVSVAPVNTQTLDENERVRRGPGSSILVPVLDGDGHTRQVVTLENGERLGLYVSIIGMRSVGNSNSAARVLVDLACGEDYSMAVNHAARWVSMNPLLASIKAGGSMGQSQQIMRLNMEACHRLYTVAVTLVPGPRAISNRARKEVMKDMAKNGGGKGGWGNALPMEENSGGIQSVMTGGGHASSDPTAYDDIDPNRGGYGPPL